MLITLHLPPDRHATAILAVQRLKRFQLYVLPRIAGGVLLLLAAAFVALGVAADTPGVVKAALFPGVFGLIYVFQPVWIMAVIRRRVARIPDEPRTVTITDEGVAVATPTSTASFAWSTVTSVLETDEIFVFRRYRIIALALPKSAFSAGDLTALRALLAGRQLV